MKASEIFDAYLNLLWNAFQYDLSILSIWWMWAALLIPALAYLLSMCLKWTLLLAPLWVPIKMIRIAWDKDSSDNNKSDLWKN